jgi:putative membrane protein
VPLPRADLLAIERTVLANERTFLAYFRTAAVLLTSALAILNIEIFVKMRDFALVLLAGSPIVLALGLWRYVVVRRKVSSLAKDSAEPAGG